GGLADGRPGGAGEAGGPREPRGPGAPPGIPANVWLVGLGLIDPDPDGSGTDRYGMVGRG
ncbi:MAG: hypothetical protein ACRDNZ_06795, partial [Streptosporangiaceae bacterium]